MSRDLNGRFSHLAPICSRGGGAPQHWRYLGCALYGWTMHKLPPASISRLYRLAQAGARFYQVKAYMRRLEVLGLIAATGRTNPEEQTVEYRITESGKAELQERYGEDSIKTIEG